MEQTLSTAWSQIVVLDHMSSESPTVTHVRGTIISGSILNLKALGQYERYVDALDSNLRDTLPFVLATSWIDIEDALAHYRACDRLLLPDSVLARAGELMAGRIADTFLAQTLRTSRAAGLQSTWVAVKQSDRLWERLYRGGGCTVLQTGPKDLVKEVHGIPLVESPYFRSSYTHFGKAIAAMFCKAVFVKNVRPRAPHPHRLATALSWV